MCSKKRMGVKPRLDMTETKNSEPMHGTVRSCDHAQTQPETFLMFLGENVRQPRLESSDQGRLLQFPVYCP